GLNVTQSGGTISGPINASATGGNVSLTQAGGYTLGTLNATGAVAVTSTAADVVVGAGANIASGTGTTLAGLNVTQSGGTISGLINATATSGDVSLTQAGGYTLGLLAAPVSVTVSTGGAIADGNAGLNVVTPSATLSAATGVGSIADPLETQVAGLAVSSSGGEIGIANSGDLTLGNVTFGGANAQIATTGLMVATGTVSVLAGNLTLGANNGMVMVNNNVTVSGDLALNSGIGDMGFDGASVSGNNVTLNGNNLFVGFTTSTAPTTVSAGTLMTATSAGNLNVLGGANSGANALLEGMNVNLTVGTTAGFLNVAGGSNGATAQISSVSPTTINVFFPNLGSGGYFVDGVEGAVTNGNTGFFAGGQPAVLAQNLIVTYGLAPPPPPPPPPATGGGEGEETTADDQTTNNLNTISEIITGPETQGDGSTGGATPDEKEKKGLPTCK
ncbi:MAG TPA: hypothetical protein VFR39_08255, partial [Burkholderiales bacterium]|nr:hypothetical protein [Burkholderiales bacterium]